MKTIKAREFFRSRSVVKALPIGETIRVTDNGTAGFLVTKFVKPPPKTQEQLEREALLVSRRNGPKVNFTEAIRELKGR